MKILSFKSWNLLRRWKNKYDNCKLEEERLWRTINKQSDMIEEMRKELNRLAK